MSFLDGFFDNLLTGTLTPKGDLGDFRHAAYLYNTNNFRLAPKSKFLYHVVFEFTSQALTSSRFFPQLTNRHREEVNMLVKNVKLPEFEAQTETRNQYNRKKNFQTAIQYSPVDITMHDDNFGITTAMLEAYYRYYFRDGNYSTGSAAFAPRSTYKGAALANKKYGLDNGSQQPFFSRITIYQLARHQWTGFTLVNPLITRWGHDSLDNSSSEPTANTMTVAYESVFYTRGQTGRGSPAGFASSHYDLTPSPITISGGGTGSFLGPGGLLDGVGSVLNDIATGNFDLGTILDGVNTVRNAGRLTLKGLRQEGLSLLGGAATSVLQPTLGSINNTVFPKSNGNGGNNTGTTATGGQSSASDPNYAARIAQAQANNGIDI